jgi:hypothetical protein
MIQTIDTASPNYRQSANVTFATAMTQSEDYAKPKIVIHS